MKSYQKLESQFFKLNSLDHATAILSWDEAVNMPSGSGKARAQALAELKVLKHEKLVSQKLYDLLQEAESASAGLNAWQKANLREIKRIILSARAIQNDLVEAASLANSECEQTWRLLRPENNWKEFLPFFNNVVALSKEEASQRSQKTGLSPYDSLLDQYNPGITSIETSVCYLLMNY